MPRRARLEDLTASQKQLVGLLLVGIGLGTAWLVDQRPERLRAPAWVAYAACACFVLAGAAVLLHGRVPRRVFLGAIALLLGGFTTLAGWIAFGPGVRQCISTFPVIGSEWACRSVFGVSALVLLGLLVVALQQVWRPPPAG